MNRWILLAEMRMLGLYSAFTNQAEVMTVAVQAAGMSRTETNCATVVRVCSLKPSLVHCQQKCAVESAGSTRQRTSIRVAY
jgi:uncharacterized NAD(P)/FAD-binding protein YdhS